MSRPNPLVLVVSESYDIHADWVIAHLHERSASVVRLHPEDFADIPAYTFEVNSNARWRLETAAGPFHPDAVTAVYHRRPSPPVPPPKLSPTEAAFWRDEVIEVLAGLLAAVPSRVRWVNAPAALQGARNKIHQLTLAKYGGLRVPRTLVTNNPARARAFFDEVGRRAICKTLSHGRVADTERQAYGLAT